MNEALARFYDHLRRERATKLEAIDLFGNGTLRLFEQRVGAGQVDISDDYVARLKRQVAEVEQILSEAGQSLD
jgi:hypothetical protein